MKLFSGEKLKGEKIPNPLKSEHLKEGVSPIIACIGTPEQFRGGEQYEVVPNPSSDNNRNVNYYGKPEELKRQNLKNAGDYSYVISPIDNLDKFFEKFRDCTGLVVAGLEKGTGNKISFLSHQDPNYFVPNTPYRDKFINDLSEQIKELKDRCEDETIDAVIVGGNYFSNSSNFQKNYLMSIALLSKEVKGVLGFEPIVITGPKTTEGQDNVFYDNSHRRLYIMRPKVAQEGTKSYLPSDIDTQRPGWEEDEARAE